MSSSAQKNDKVMIRQKDYELLSIKRIRQFHVSTNDPIINPPKKKAAKKSPIGFSNSSGSNNLSSNPLAKKAIKLNSKTEASATNVNLPKGINA